MLFTTASDDWAKAGDGLKAIAERKIKTINLYDIKVVPVTFIGEATLYLYFTIEGPPDQIKKRNSTQLIDY